MEKKSKKAKGNGNVEGQPVLIPFEIVITWGGGVAQCEAQSSEPESEGAVSESFEFYGDYGKAWENELLKLPKAVLLTLLSGEVKARCSEMLDGMESKMYLMLLLKRQCYGSQTHSVPCPEV